MTIAIRPDQRLVIARIALERVGVDMSPEFEAALLPKPREKMVTGGTQAGKSTEGAAEIWVELPLIDPDRQYLFWNIVPSYQSPHKEMDYLSQWAEQMGIQSRRHFPEGNACRLELLGGRVVVESKTAMDIEGISGEPCDGVLVTEAGQMPPGVRQACLERTMTRRGWIAYTGTLEDDEAKPRYVWYGQLAQKWRDEPSEDHFAVSLPSWANRSIFPGGRQDPEILRLEREMDPHTFNRRIGGVPSGVEFAVYPQLGTGGEAKWGYPVTPETRWLVGQGAGGHDYGGAYGHPSTLVVVSVVANGTKQGLAVVREAWAYRGSDRDLIKTRRLLMSQRYNVASTRWGFDPMQREAAELEHAYITKSGENTRLGKVGLVESRLNNRNLVFDFAGPGVREAFEQGQRIHYVRRYVAGKGEVYDYAKIDDDYWAAIENAVQVIDGEINYKDAMDWVSAYGRGGQR